MSHSSEPFWRTGSLAKRWSSRTLSTPWSSVPTMARPLSAPRSNARKWAVTTSPAFALPALRRGRQRLQPDVSKLHGHRRTDVHLKSEEAAELPILQILVHDHARDRPIQDLDDRAAARDQVHLVPVPGLDQRLQLVGRLLQVPDDFRPGAVGDEGGLAAHRQEPAAALLVDLARELILGVDVVLICLRHPLADVRTRRQLHAPELDPAVGRADLVFDLQLEVSGSSAPPDDEGVL